MTTSTSRQPASPGASGPSRHSADPRILAQGLGRISQRRTILLGVLVLLPPLLIVHQGMDGPRSVRDAMVLGWVAAYAVTSMITVWSRCPRCRQLFHRVLGFLNPFSRRCQSCGLGLDGSEPH